MAPHRFHPRLQDCWREVSWRDVGAGVTVGVIALPLAMAFAIASGLKPEAGLTTAIVAGFLISLLGGSNVQIGGPAGAFIVVVYGIVERHGLGGLALSTFLAGLLLMAMGLMKLGALVRQIPISIVIGFTNGIAVLIALSQVRDLLGLDLSEKLPADFFAQIQVLSRHASTWNPYALLLGLLCIAILAAWPRLTRLRPTTVDEALRTHALRSVSRLPGPIVALVGLSALAAWLRWPVETIGSRFGHIPQGFPPIQWPDLSWTQAKLLVTPTLTLAFLGAIESLLCARVADKAAADLPPHDPNQELIAQGVANLASPLLGGMPATGTIARTVTNVRAGARTPAAGMVHALTVAAIMALAAPLALQVPLAVLAGILLFMAWNMGEWHEFARLRHFSGPYRTVLVGTFALTVVFDLTVAVEIGLLLACAFFIYRMGTLFRIVPVLAHPLPPGTQAFELYGSLFFGAAGRLESLVPLVQPGTQRVVLDLHRLVQLDTSGLDALQQLWRTLQRRGVGLLLADVNEQPLSLIRRSGFEAELGSDCILPNLTDPKIAGFPDR